jgi:uncharacterized cupredoxin-like copper-binding protein
MRHRRKLVALVAVLALAVTALAMTVTGSSAKSGTTLKLKASPSGAIKFDKKKLSAAKGKVTIVMTNPSSSGSKHGIAVEGKGVDKDGKIVSPGKSSTLTVTLKKAGKYEFYCPFDGHKGEGMKGTLTVH